VKARTAPTFFLFALTSLAWVHADVIPNRAEDAKPIHTGARAPDAPLRGLDDKAVSLKSILKKKPTVLIFYRGGWCPFCSAHLLSLSRIQGDVLKRGYQIIAISPESPAEMRKTRETNKVNYTLLSDSSATAMKRYGVAYRLDDETYKKYVSYGVDLEKSSGGATHHILPVPSLFIVNQAGKVTFAHSNPDYKVRLTSAEILRAIGSK
jgi:peroxiredoxin